MKDMEKDMEELINENEVLELQLAERKLQTFD